MKYFFLLFIACVSTSSLMAQDDLSKLFNDTAKSKDHVPVIATFKSLKLINGQTNETMHRNELLFAITHRFGDIAGANGGVDGFYGLDNSSDILIAFDYGISNRLSVGIGRAKGAPNGVNTSQKQLIDLNLKYKLLQQTEDDYMPFSVTLFGNGVASGMKKTGQVTSDADFNRFGDRMSYIAQAIITRKFNDNLSLALLPTYLRRNYVSFMDMNNMFGLGVGGRIKFNRRMAIVVDYFYSLRSKESKDYFLQQQDFKFYNPLGVGLEIETGGHVFNISFTNSTAILENQFISSTSSSWRKGGFRWGFSISRTFSFHKEKDK